MDNGDEHVSLVLAGTIYTIPRAAASKSAFLAGVLEMQTADEIIPVPFIQNTTVVQILYDFFHVKPIFQTEWLPYLCYQVLLAANGMDMPSLLELCVEEIAARWQKTSKVEEIRAEWGLEDNLTKKEKGAIAQENFILEISDTATIKQKAYKTKPWAWPPEMLFLITSKLPTRELARVRGVCAEVYDCVHSLPGRGDLEVFNIQNTTMPFVERHCLLLLQNKQQLEGLQSLKNLQHLKIAWGINLGADGAAALATLQNLKHLEVGFDNKIGAEGATALATLYNLKKLIINSHNKIGAEGATALSALHNLKELVIGPNNIGPEGAVALSALHNLKELVIGFNNKIGAKGAAALSTLQNLQYLVIGSGNNIGAAGATTLSSLQNLQYLEIGWDNNIGTEGATALSTLQNLQHLVIWRNNIGTEGATALSTLQNLQHLVIWGNNIGAEGAAALSALHNLKHLEIGPNNNIGPEGIHALSRLKNLQILKIQRCDNQFSETDEKELIELLPDTTINFISY